MFSVYTQNEQIHVQFMLTCPVALPVYRQNKDAINPLPVAIGV